MKNLNLFYTSFYTNLLLAGLFIFAFAAYPVALSGQGEQAAKGLIQGIVVDSLSGLPMEYVTVALQHPRFPKILNGGLTDEKGRFAITGIAPGNYRLSLSFLGYEDRVVAGVEVKADNLLTQLGQIRMSQGVALQEVEVVAQRSTIEQRFDRLVYNVAADMAAGNQTLNDMLRKVPMVNVDAEGNVTIKGSSNIQVLIDGRPSGMFASSVADALRAIPADQVEKIEVLTMPSARYDAEGSAGVINIITKQKRIEGHSISVNSSVGNLFTALNTNIQTRGKKMGFTFSAGGSAMLPRNMRMETQRNTWYNNEWNTLAQSGSNRFTTQNWNLQLGMDYTINTFHTVSTTFRYAPGGGSNVQLQSIQLQNTLDTPFLLHRQSSNSSDKGLYTWATDYRRTFNNPDNTWNTTLQVAQENRDLRYNVLETEQGTGSATINEKGVNKGTNLEFVAQTDLVKQLGGKAKLETGAKLVYRNMESQANLYLYSPDAATYLFSPERSFSFPYEQTVMAAYAETDAQIAKGFTLRTGLRLENTQNSIGSATRTHYTNLAPTLSLSYIKDAANMSFSYARKLTRPGLSHINPFENRADPYSWRQGNPYLLPELVDAFDFNFSQPLKQTFLNGNFFYHRTRDIIENYITPISADQTLNAYQNIGTNYRLGFNGFMSATLLKKFNLKAGTNLVYYGLIKTSLPKGSYNEGMQVTAFALLGLPAIKGWNSELLGAYVTPQFAAQQRSNGFYTYQITVKKGLIKNADISLTLVNPFHPRMFISQTNTSPSVQSYTQIAFPLRAVSLGFKYSFNKNIVSDPNAEKRILDSTDLKAGESGKPY